MPRVPLTPKTRFALVFLRFYLIVMLGLILYKFVRMLSGDPAAQ